MKDLTLNTESLMTVISSLSEAKTVIKEALEESIKALNYAKGVGSEDSNYDFYEMVGKNDVFFMDLIDDIESFDEKNKSSKDVLKESNDLVNDYQIMFDNFSTAAKIKSSKKSARKDLYKNFYFKK
jgi:hypothetical protein